MSCAITERIEFYEALLPELTPLQQDVAGSFLRRARAALPADRVTAIEMLSEASRVIYRPVERGYRARW